MFDWLRKLFSRPPTPTPTQIPFQPRYQREEVAVEEEGEDISVEAMLMVQAAIARMDGDYESSIA